MASSACHHNNVATFGDLGVEVDELLIQCQVLHFGLKRFHRQTRRNNTGGQYDEPDPSSDWRRKRWGRALLGIHRIMIGQLGHFHLV